MDAESGQDRRPGGTVQPKAPTSKGKKAPRSQAQIAEHYELRDPFAEVTYRAKTLPEMAQQAERLGALRFHAIAADGTRIPIERTDGEWKRSVALEVQKPVSPKEDLQRPSGTGAATILPVDILVRLDGEAAQLTNVERLERELSERYVIKRAPMRIGAVMIGQTEYRYRGDIARIAFTESTFRLTTDNNNPSVARSMVDVAEARNWQGLRVSGHEDFRRMVWLEASLRGIEAVGYEPNQVDRQMLRKELDVRQFNRIERTEVREAGEGAWANPNASERGSGGRKVVLAALEAVLVAKRVPARQREAVMTAAADNLAARLRKGEIHKVKVLDQSAPSQRTEVQPAREVQRSREHAAPAR